MISKRRKKRTRINDVLDRWNMKFYLNQYLMKTPKHRREVFASNRNLKQLTPTGFRKQTELASVQITLVCSPLEVIRYTSVHDAASLDRQNWGTVFVPVVVLYVALVVLFRVVFRVVVLELPARSAVDRVVVSTGTGGRMNVTVRLSLG